MTIVNVIVPPRLAARSKDKRGYPIFYTVLVRDKEQVDFSLIDARKVAQCGFQQLCGLCGQSLVQNLTGLPSWLPTYFIGGPVSVMKSKIFQDPPMHEECCRYAMKICPWMILSSYRRAAVEKDGSANRVGVCEISERPPFFGLLRANGFQYFFEQNLFKAVEPRQLVKLWRPGSDEQVSLHDARTYAEESLAKSIREDTTDAVI